MSKQQARVASLLLREGFGDLVEKVGRHLLSCGASSLAEIVQGTGLKANQVKKCLVVFIQHQLVAFETHSSGRFLLYRIVVEHVLLRARFPQYIHATRVLFEEAGELICEELLQQGQALMSQCIRRVVEKLENAGKAPPNIGKVVKTKFISLVQGRYLQRVKPPSSEVTVASHGDQEMGGVITMPAFERFELPPAINAVVIPAKKRRRESNEDEDLEPSAKKTKTEKAGESVEKPVDDGIYWSVNYGRFHQYFRDQDIISAVSEKIDPTAGCVMRCLLNMSSDLSSETCVDTGVSPSLYKASIMEYLPGRPKLTERELDQYLKALTDDQAQFVRRTDDSGGGAYTIDLHHCSRLLCQAAVEVIVRERFGSKCLRIFRLLLLKKILEQWQVVEMAMIPGKESRELLYSLLAENFVTLQEVPRTTDYAPSRTFYLFSVNLPVLARLLLERTYKALGNLISRRVFEMNENKRLLEKYEQYVRQQEVQARKRGGLGEMEDVLTPDEKEKAESVKRKIDKIEQGELQLDETLRTLANFVNAQVSLKS